MFTFIFPAFTGIAAGLGLSGDLKDPRVSIPKGTIWATAVGIVIYIAVAIKLWWSAPLEALATDELYMENIALWGPIIPVGLAAAAMSSAFRDPSWWRRARCRPLRPMASSRKA